MAAGFYYGVQTTVVLDTCTFRWSIYNSFGTYKGIKKPFMFVKFQRKQLQSVVNMADSKYVSDSGIF